MKVEIKHRVEPLNMNELIDQGHPLFIGKFLNSEASYEDSEVNNRAQYAEKHLEPPLISSNYRYAGAAVRLVLQRCKGRREGRLKDCNFRVRDGFGANCGVCNNGMENVWWWLVKME